MITIPHSILREFHSVARKLDRRRQDRTVEIAAGRSGQTLQIAGDDVVLRYHSLGRRPETRLTVPLETFADLQSRANESVVFSSNSHGQVEVSNSDDDASRVRCYPAPRPVRFPLQTPERFTPARLGLLGALAGASRVAAKDSTSRYVLNRIQLRGKAGEIVASDSRQLLKQDDFVFPWSGDVLVPRSDLYGALSALGHPNVAMARTTTHVWVKTGSWSIGLLIDSTGRFPDVAGLFERLRTLSSHLVLHPADRSILVRELSEVAWK